MKQRTLLAKPKAKEKEIKPVPKDFMNPPVSEVKSNRVRKNDRFTEPFLAKLSLKDEEDIRIYEAIQRKRLQILVWSRMYYILSYNMVSDYEFDKVGHELVDLQTKYPEISKIVAYYEEFADWDASTGFHLPLDDEWVVWKTNQLMHRKRKGE